MQPGIPFYKIIISLFLLLAANTVHAQSLLQGAVTNAGHFPLPYAIVGIQSLPDSTLLKTELTDGNGIFKISVPAAARYIITISAVGYSVVTRITGAGTAPVQIALTPIGKELAGAGITSRKPLIERKADRTIFNVESSISAIGSDAFEVLRRAPGIRVGNNDITIAGKSSVAVMINDRLVQLSGDELVAMLKSIPAEQLTRIEIITTPPAKYDAAGNSGLINIITKKHSQDGLNGSITGSYTQRSLASGGLTGLFNYRRGRLNIFGNGNAYNGYTRPVERTTTYFPDVRMEQENRQVRQSIFNRLQAGADFAISKGMVVGVLGTLGMGGFKLNEDDPLITKAISTHTGALDSLLTNASHSSDIGHRKVLNLNYEWKIDTGGRKLGIDMDYFNRIGNKALDFITSQSLPGGTPTGLTGDNRTSGRQEIDIRAAKLDVVWPSKLAQFSFGGKLSFIHDISDNIFTYRKDDVYITDYGKTNAFDYRENTQALYISANRTLGKWEVQAGLRGEYTRTRSHSPAANQTVTNEYFKLFPTAYLQYSMRENHIFNINYSRRIERPDFWIMNPFRTYFTATSYNEGNPFLQPSFSNNFELGYTLHSKYSFTLFTNLEQGIFTRASILDTATQSYHFTHINTGRMNHYGLRGEATITPVKWWETTIECSGYYQVFSSGYYGEGVSYNKPSLTLESANTFTCNKAGTVLAEISFSYNSPQQSDFDIQYSSSSLSAGIKALFFKKALTLVLNAEDIFRTDRWKLTNLHNGTEQDHYADERGGRLSLSWKFGKRNIKEKREHAAGGDEVGRAQ